MRQREKSSAETGSKYMYGKNNRYTRFIFFV